MDEIKLRSECKPSEAVNAKPAERSVLSLLYRTCRREKDGKLSTTMTNEKKPLLPYTNRNYENNEYTNAGRKPQYRVEMIQIDIKPAPKGCNILVTYAGSASKFNVTRDGNKNDGNCTSSVSFQASLTRFRRETGHISCPYLRRTSTWNGNLLIHVNNIYALSTMALS